MLKVIQSAGDHQMEAVRHRAAVSDARLLMMYSGPIRQCDKSQLLERLFSIKFKFLLLIYGSKKKKNACPSFQKMDVETASNSII